MSSVTILDPRPTVTVREERIEVVAVGGQGPAGPPSLDVGDVVTQQGAVAIGGPGGTPIQLPPDDSGRVFAAAYADIATALAEAAGKTLVLGTGSYTGLANLAPASGTTIEGAGEAATILSSPASPTSPVFDLNGVTNVTLRGFSLAIPSGTASGSGYGVRVRGACADVLIEDVTATGFVEAVSVDGSAGGSAANQSWSVKVASNATGGTWKLGVGVGAGEIAWATGLAHSVAAATLQTALEALSGVGAGNVAVAGGPGPGTAYTVTFQSALAGLHVRILVDGNGLTGGDNAVVVTELVRGGGPWVTQATLRRVTALDSPSSWGMGFDWVDGLILEGCRARGHWLDGLKMRRRVANWQIIGGDFSKNGRGWLSNATTTAGDGIDAYAGGERGRITMASFNDNAGNGLQFKNDDGTGPSGAPSGYGSGKYGLNRKLELDHIEASRNMAGSGLYLTYVVGTGDFAVSHVSVTGGLFEDNMDDGVTITARNVTLTSVKTRRNRLRGIHVHQYAQYVDIIGCESIGNGSGAGTGYGAVLSGKHIKLIGGQYLGADSDGLTLGTDPSTLTKYHITNIRVESTAEDVLIDCPTEGFNSSGRGILVVSGATAPIHVRQRVGGGLVPGGSLLYGGPGSMVWKTDATLASDHLWLKVAGAVDAVGTWRRVAMRGVVAKAADYTTVGSDDVILVTAGAANKTITLVTAIGHAGLEQTVVRVDGAAGNVIVDGNAAETILTPGGAPAATKTLGNQGAFVTLVSDGARWVAVAAGGTIT